ncbi:hypothetical protein ILYODFUR_037039 [Ilyodon furcidens]|uniref:Uncharacterized protein n=1 Tax=Ilyodon furcidens TaxID=33524 RepID=A0ABV0VN56_9TELE
MDESPATRCSPACTISRPGSRVGKYQLSWSHSNDLVTSHGSRNSLYRFGIFSIASSTSSLFTKNIFKALNNSSASGMSRPFATIMSAAPFKAPATPSRAPFPCLD